MTQAELYDSFPDGLKKAIRAYEPLEGKTVEQLHEMLCNIRKEKDLPPWHPFTEFIKNIAQGCQASTPGVPPAPWVIRKRDPEIYVNNTVFKWVNIKLIIRRGTDMVEMFFAACPRIGLVWAYSVEGPFRTSSFHIDGVYASLESEAVLKHAVRLLKGHKGKSPHEFIEVEHIIQARDSSKRREKSDTRQEESNNIASSDQLTLKDILTPDPEAPKAAVDPITEADKEVLLTMLEMASLKLKELGMYSTLSRWRATVRRLTKHEIQTETATEGTSGTT